MGEEGERKRREMKMKDEGEHGQVKTVNELLQQ
jgi:hypothetical protein